MKDIQTVVEAHNFLTSALIEQDAEIAHKVVEAVQDWLMPEDEREAILELADAIMESIEG